MKDQILDNILQTTKLHLERAKFSYEEIRRMNINTDLFLDKEKVKTIDAFIFRFIKLQDFMGDKLFKLSLDRIGEYKSNMSLLDVLDKLEKMELISSSDKWIDYRKIRNKLTHEYPDNQEEVIKGIKIALDCFPEIENIVIRLENYLKSLKKIA